MCQHKVGMVLQKLTTTCNFGQPVVFEVLMKFSCLLKLVFVFMLMWCSAWDYCFNITNLFIEFISLFKTDKDHQPTSNLSNFQSFKPQISINENVFHECLIARERRRGIELVHDDAEKELLKEIQVYSGIQTLLLRTQEQLTEQARSWWNIVFMICF